MAGTLAVAAPFERLLARGVQRPAHERAPSRDYGPLVEALDETTGLPLLKLPRHFRYLSFGWAGEVMNDGAVTPAYHDGMAAFPAGQGRIYLVRNHEVPEGRAAFAPAIAYDLEAGGGTVTLEFDTLRGEPLDSFASISGTLRNCAGGPTPWGSWLTCEETTLGVASGQFAKDHGYIFEVPAGGTGLMTPYTAMGRFTHEAVAVDPASGYVYETEDWAEAGFYRFRPSIAGDLGGGGVLEMLGVRKSPQRDMHIDQTRDWLDVEWHAVDDPDPAAAHPTVFEQGFANGGARFGRLEGAWYGSGRIYFVSTIGGNAARGQVFEYDPRDERLRVLFESPSADVLNMPDNVCVSPRGGLVLCEDASHIQHLQGLTADGVIFRFAQNTVDLRRTPAHGFRRDYRASEFAGACYSPDGEWLFVNVQSPGITFAITGPWGDGAL